MHSKFSFSMMPIALALLLATLGTAQARVYPGNACVSAKQRAASTLCRAVVSKWSLWEKSQDSAGRDLAITAASQRFAAAWTRAEHTAAKQNVDCSDTTAAAADIETLLNGAVAAIVTDVNSGLDVVGNKADAKCGAALLTAAATECAGLLTAEATHIARLAAGKAKLDKAQTGTRNSFSAAFTRATAKNCPTGATGPELGGRVDALVSDLVTNTIVSPNVDNTQFTTIAPTGTVAYQGRSLTPLCSRGTPYYFFAKRGTVNKLVMYYEGGGACWDYFTCNLGIFNQSINPNGGDNPNNQQAGFGDLSNPDNPFKDWNIVFTSYCTGDIHFGDMHQDYHSAGNTTSVNHFGYQNARVVEKWAREHFVNPDEVFVTGSSAGAYGAFFNAPLLHDVWPDANFSVLADAGNGVITPAFISSNFPSWNFESNVPAYIPGVLDSIQNGTGIPAYTQAVAAYFPDTAWAHYATAYDGSSGGQTGFYNVMLNPANVFEWPIWWDATCQWHTKMLQQAQATAAAIALTTGNYRYYVGRGSRHTGWGSNTVVYNDDTLASTPALKDWTTLMRGRDPAWKNVVCKNCGTILPGDPQPNPLTAPFQQNGPDVDIVCP